MKKGKRVLFGFGWVLAGAAFLSIMGLVTMTLWNWLIPELFNGSTVTFLQAIGLIALGKLLTGFSGMGGHSWKRRHWGHHNDGMWRSRMEEKMSHMTPEEKEKFKKYYYDRCGWKNYDRSQPTGDQNANTGS